MLITPESETAPSVMLLVYSDNRSKRTAHNVNINLNAKESFEFRFLEARNSFKLSLQFDHYY